MLVRSAPQSLLGQYRSMLLGGLRDLFILHVQKVRSITLVSLDLLHLREQKPQRVNFTALMRLE